MVGWLKKAKKTRGTHGKPWENMGKTSGNGTSMENMGKYGKHREKTMGKYGRHGTNPMEKHLEMEILSIGDNRAPPALGLANRMDVMGRLYGKSYLENAGNRKNL